MQYQPPPNSNASVSHKGYAPCHKCKGHSIAALGHCDWSSTCSGRPLGENDRPLEETNNSDCPQTSAYQQAPRHWRAPQNPASLQRHRKEYTRDTDNEDKETDPETKTENKTQRQRQRPRATPLPCTYQPGGVHETDRTQRPQARLDPSKHGHTDIVVLDHLAGFVVEGIGHVQGAHHILATRLLVAHNDFEISMPLHSTDTKRPVAITLRLREVEKKVGTTVARQRIAATPKKFFAHIFSTYVGFCEEQG